MLFIVCHLHLLQRRLFYVYLPTYVSLSVCVCVCCCVCVYREVSSNRVPKLDLSR